MTRLFIAYLHPSGDFLFRTHCSTNRSDSCWCDIVRILGKMSP